MVKVHWVVAFLAATAVFAGRPACAQMSSANYSIPVAVINSGGGVMSSANYTLFASIGEPIVGLSTSMRGDVNKDGFVNTADVGTVLRIADGSKKASDADVSFVDADRDSNSKIELLDAQSLAKSLASGSGAGFRLEAGFLPAAFQ